MRQPRMGFTQLFIYVEPSSPPPHIPDLIPLRKQMLYGTRVESSIPKAARCHCTQAQLPTRWDRARHLHWHTETWTEHEALKNQDGKCPYPAPATTGTLPDISLGHQPHVFLPLLLKAVLHQETNSGLPGMERCRQTACSHAGGPQSRPVSLFVPRMSSWGRAGTVGCRENGVPAGPLSWISHVKSPICWKGLTPGFPSATPNPALTAHHRPQSKTLISWA